MFVLFWHYWGWTYTPNIRKIKDFLPELRGGGVDLYMGSTYTPGFQRLHFSFFSCWDPCVHREFKKMAPIARKDVSLIRSKNAFIQTILGSNSSDFFYKIHVGHLHQIIII